MALKFHTFVILLCLIAIAKIHAQGTGEVRWTHELSLEKGVSLKWTTQDPVWLTMEMSGPTKGYIAVGFSPNGGMKDSDIVIGWVDDKGVGHIKDYYGIGNTRPVEDPVQDYELLKASEIGNRTTIRFRRKWNTCDTEHDYIIGDDTIRIIWAYNEEDPPIVNGKFHPAYHFENRGVRKSFLKIPAQHVAFSDDRISAPINGNVKYWDVKMENNNVTAEDDIYFCTIAKFPALENKNHMIGFRPLLDEGNKWNIHHMFMYECIVPASDGGTAKLFDEHVGRPGGRCYTPNMPPAWGRYCINIPILWTSGSEGTMMPDNVGFPLGEEHGGSTYFMFEIHYDNPQLKTFTDHSGFRIFYTDQLREYDGGVAAIGHKVSPFEVVPPSMSSFTAMGYCTAECTAQVIPPTGINVISVLLHAHLAGRKVALKHIRNGKELLRLAKDDKYDYNYQQARVIEPSRKILPGDELLTICEYDTTDRNTPAFGGLGTRDEMCTSFVYYYPRIPLVDCKSQPEFYSFLNALGIQKVEGKILEEVNMPYIPLHNQELDYADNPFYLTNSTYENPLTALDAMSIVDADPALARFPTVGDVIRNLNWSGPLGKEIERKWVEGDHYAFCTGPKNKRFPLQNYIVKMPTAKEYAEAKTSC